MARLALLSSPEESDHDEGAISARSGDRRAANLGSPSPAASFSSDKENRGVLSVRNDNGKSRMMPPPSPLPTPETEEPPQERANKRRKLSERGAANATQVAHEKRLESAGDLSVYDPDQSIEERRVIRKDYRDLSKELTGTIISLSWNWTGWKLIKVRLSRRVPKANFERFDGDSRQSERPIRDCQADL